MKLDTRRKTTTCHCGLDPQSPENKEILKQVQNDVKNSKIVNKLFLTLCSLF